MLQGYVYFQPHGTPGQSDFGTTIMIDRNGRAPDLIGQADLAVVDLAGVGGNEVFAAYLWM
jgi:hypothetical protein